MNSASQESTQVAVVMVPLCSQGHLNQLLHLSRLVSARKIPVHYAGSETHNRQAMTRVHGFDSSVITNLHFHNFQTPSFPNLPPDSSAPDKFPSQLLPTAKASMQLREPVLDLVKQLSDRAKRVVVVFDSLMAYVVQDLHNIANVELCCFHSIPAFSMFSFYWEETGKPAVPTEAADVLRELPSVEGCFTRGFLEFAELQREARTFHYGNLYNSNRVIEGLYLDMLSKAQCLGGEKHWAFGPFTPVSLPERNTNSHHKCLDWLDKQWANTGIYVSFGTTSSLSNEQIKEIALGLERSEAKFIWVLRDADRGDIFAGQDRKADLPHAFEEKVKERGIVVRDWAPQLEILGHPSTGGFMSHCGWNSCMESISMGVPIAAWPMHSDQPRNAVLLTKVLKVGQQVTDWAHRDELVSSSAVEGAVRRLMASAEGDETRRRAKELARAVKKSVTEGGAAKLEMDSFIAHITR